MHLKLTNSSQSQSKKEHVDIGRSSPLPLLSVVVPLYNEQALLKEHLNRFVSYLRTLEDEFQWEIVIVNDGSDDDTNLIITAFAEQYENVIALHHPRNFGVGQALSFGIANTEGDYVITMDVDLSYDEEHIGMLARSIRDQQVKMVLASPYMKGGSIRNVPWLRRVLSILGNRFLSFFVEGRISTLTSMVRAYDGKFIRSMNLRAMGMDVMPEMVHKSIILRGSIQEVPAQLDWGPQAKYGESRVSSMRIFRHIFATIFAGFVFRPFLFFVIPGILLLGFSFYVGFWMFAHYFEALGVLRSQGELESLSQALAVAYGQYPHTYVFGLLSAMLAIQLIGLGVLALQSKQYFEELFHLGSHPMRSANRTSKR